MKFAWTDENVETLLRLHREGLSGAVIAAQFGRGVTRNSVIGKLHRLGIRGHGQPKQAMQRRPRRSQGIKFGRQVEKSPRANGDAAAAKSEYRPQQVIEAPVAKRYALDQLGPNDCRFPIGDPRSPDFHFCGHEIEKGSYWEYHRSLAIRVVDNKTAMRESDRIANKTLAGKLHIGCAGVAA